MHAFSIEMLPIRLDLSENEVGALAAHELREYIRSKDCRLKRLAIRKADIDDSECRYDSLLQNRNNAYIV